MTAELYAGNSILEVGHNFPAPPAGAFSKLANEIRTRARTSGDGLGFYERNRSLDSGEFLQFLRPFHDWETSKSVSPNKVPETEAWTRILGLLREA